MTKMHAAKAGSCRGGYLDALEVWPSSLLTVPAARSSRFLIGKAIIRSPRNSNKTINGGHV